MPRKLAKATITLITNTHGLMLDSISIVRLLTCFPTIMVNGQAMPLTAQSSWNTTHGLNTRFSI
jgi:hypothetical protein